MNQLQQEYVSREAAATYLGLSVRQVGRLIACGDLPASKLGETKQAHIRIRRSDLEVLMARKQVARAA